MPIQIQYRLVEVANVNGGYRSDNYRIIGVIFRVNGETVSQGVFTRPGCEPPLPLAAMWPERFFAAGLGWIKLPLGEVMIACDSEYIRLGVPTSGELLEEEAINSHPDRVLRWAFRQLVKAQQPAETRDTVHRFPWTEVAKRFVDNRSTHQSIVVA